MSENEPRFESSIERFNTRVTFQIGRKAVLFDMHNSQLFEFSPPYNELDHVFRANDNGKRGVYYFRQSFKNLYATLDDNDFTKIRSKYPSERDEEVWMSMQLKHLEQDLQEFEESDE